MTRWIRQTGLVVAMTVVAGLVVSCGSDNGMEPTPELAAITVTVTAGGDPISGVTVDLYAQGGSTVQESATTGTDGMATFPDLDPGTYEVEITVPTGYGIVGGSTRQTVMASETQDGAASFTLETTGAVVEVTMTNYAFTPSDLTIEPGTTVRWVNETSMFHTITPDGHSEWSEGSVNTMGETFTYTFGTEGSFPYYCSPHQSLGMVGSVTVAAP